MSSKGVIGVFFGGFSVEHEISVLSARNIVNSLIKAGYRVVGIGIDKEAKWGAFSENELVKFLNDNRVVSFGDERLVLPVPGGGAGKALYHLSKKSYLSIDCAFPILHGTFGEDGTIQGIFEHIQIPYVGSGVLGSSVNMDKEFSKRLLRERGLPITEFIVFEKGEVPSYEDVSRKLGNAVFVKPASLGSSVGISMVENKDQYVQAVKDAFTYDTKIIVERRVEGREIECSVLGGENPIASLPGEIIPRKGFYSYEAKYLDEDGAELVVPAKLDDNMIEEIKSIAVKAFKVLGCFGLARVDFFLVEDSKIIINELNTIPGFTQISMYPKLWEVSGIPQHELVGRRIEIAVERFETLRKLRRFYI